MNKILFLVYLIILFCSFVCSIINRKNLAGYFRLFSLVIAVTFIIESIGFYLLFFTKYPRQYLYHFYVPFMYTIVAYIYSKAITTGWKIKLIRWSIPSFLALALYLRSEERRVGKECRSRCSRYHQ